MNMTDTESKEQLTPATSDPADRLGEVLERFSLALDALRDFIVTVGSSLGSGPADDMTEFGRVMLATWLCGNGDELPPGAPEHLLKIKRFLAKNNISSENKLEVLHGANLPIKISADGNGLEPDLDRVDAHRFLSQSRTLKRITLQHSLLYESSLMALTSQSEWLISQLMRLFFELFPSAAGGEEKFFSLDDLERYGTIQDACDALIESRVEQQMRMPLDDWIKFFRQKTRLSLDFFEPDLPRLREIFQRRNLVVHNGGIVNAYYLNRVDSELYKDAKIGDRLFVTEDYLNAAIDLIAGSFLHLAFELWRKWDKHSDQRNATLNSIGYEWLVAERWALARRLFTFLKDDPTSPESDRLRGQVNYWQAAKWAGEYESIRREVETADYSAKSPLFRLALCVIKDDYAEVFDLLSQVLRNGDLRPDSLQKWPLFREVRKQPQYEFYSSDPEYALESNGTAKAAIPPGPVQ